MGSYYFLFKKIGFSSSVATVFVVSVFWVLGGYSEKMSKEFIGLKFSILSKSNSIFILSHKRFFKLPVYVNALCTSGGNLILSIKDIKFLRSFNQFLKTFSVWLKSSNSLYYKSLTLSGLGLRFKKVNSSSLEFKLGLSHLVYKSIPSDISVKVFKQVISISGYNKVKVGNYAMSIRNLKKPDAYKGKGFWFKYQAKKLKELQKK